MQLTLQRLDQSAAYTAGSLNIEGLLSLYTLEPPLIYEGQPNVPDKCCIPPGTYPIILAMSQKFGRVMPLLQDVPGRSAVEIHWGNDVEDTEGCIMVGIYRPQPGMIAGSVLGFGRLFPLLQQAVENKDSLSIKVMSMMTTAS